MKRSSRPHLNIAIVGRANVGKSTLFNRITGKRKAIVEKTGSTTRDRIIEIVDYAGCVFELIDTGGLDFVNKKDIPEQVEKQVTIAAEQADKIIFVCDIKTGVVPMDRKIGELLRNFNKEIILVVNKADNRQLLQNSLEFYSLGFGEPIAISSMHGIGINDLLDKVVNLSKVSPWTDSLSKVSPWTGIKIAIVGRPNSGKSSFVNTVLGEERVIVSPEPGTTRDSVDTNFEMQGKRFVIIDTAGIRSKGKIKDDVTYFSIVRTEEAIKRSDVILVIIDGMVGLTKEDFKIVGMIQDYMKPFALVVNKWDICLKQGLKEKDYELVIRRGLRFIDYAPIIFISALTGKNIQKALDASYTLAGKSQTNFSTSLLNEILKQITIKATRLYSIRQAKNAVPEFEIIAKNPATINDPNRRHIVNVLRKELGLEGIPIKISFKKKIF
ncbi:MAG: ribosome biogenesis GTPase Der [Candidatus Omnitrophica bacterium]|nr:ribosome biogenesis GTPase Der [Candidatus Omnitrophota bacterium]